MASTNPIIFLPKHVLRVILMELLSFNTQIMQIYNKSASRIIYIFIYMIKDKFG